MAHMSGDCGVPWEYRDVLKTLTASTGWLEKLHRAHCSRENPRKVMRMERRVLR